MTLTVTAGVSHVFPAFADVLDEGGSALERIGTDLDAALAAPTVGDRTVSDQMWLSADHAAQAQRVRPRHGRLLTAQDALGEQKTGKRAGIGGVDDGECRCCCLVER